MRRTNVIINDPKGFKSLNGYSEDEVRIMLVSQIEINEEYGNTIDRLNKQIFDMQNDFNEIRKLKAELKSVKKQFAKYRETYRLSELVEKTVNERYDFVTEKPAKKWWQIFKK